MKIWFNNMKIKTAFIIAGIGTVAASVLRCIQMLFYFDYETGFVTDSGVFTALYCGIVMASGIACAVLCGMDKGTCGIMQRSRSWGAGITALFVSLFLLYSGATLLMDAYNYLQFGVTYSIEPTHIMAHVPLAVLSVLFGIAALITAVCWLRGRHLPGNLGAVWMIGIIWGLYYMVLTFMTYSATATTQENLFTVGGGALMLMFLLSECKLITGMGGRKDSRYLFIFGLPAVIFWFTYVISNTVLILFGRGYAAEMPYVVQLVMLALSAHASALLICLRSPELFAPSFQNSVRSERKNAQIQISNNKNN